MIAKLHHECGEQAIARLHHKGDPSFDHPMLIRNRWIVPVYDPSTGLENDLPVLYCPWCGVNLERENFIDIAAVIQA